MNSMYKLIMLPQPILVSDEPLRIGQFCYGDDINNANQTTVHQAGSHEIAHKHPKAIAGGSVLLPKLDLSLIAEQIGWVDLDKLTFQRFPMYEDKEADNWGMEFKYRNGFKMGFQEAQSLNDKKYSEADVRKVIRLARTPKKIIPDWDELTGKVIRKHLTEDEIIQSLSKPKEYDVKVEMEQYTINYHKDLWANRIKITNNTIKVLKIL